MMETDLGEAVTGEGSLRSALSILSDRLEPCVTTSCHPQDLRTMLFASIAISLKRIADHLQNQT